jgi:hypothetical protein
MHQRILVPGKTKVTQLSCLLRFDEGFHCSAIGENAVWVFESDDLVHLHQVDVIRLQPQEAFINLSSRGLFGAAINLGHEEGLLTVAVAQSLAHADFAGAVVIVPAVVHEGDPAVDGAANDPDALRFL